jgi:hypothetical protein
MKDPFGSAPYSRKSVSSNDNTKQLVSSVMTTTSPIEQIYIYDTNGSDVGDIAGLDPARGDIVLLLGVLLS